MSRNFAKLDGAGSKTKETLSKRMGDHVRTCDEIISIEVISNGALNSIANWIIFSITVNTHNLSYESLLVEFRLFWEFGNYV